MWEQIRGVLSALLILLVFIGVLVMAYYATKLVGKQYSAGQSSSGNIRILDRTYLGQDRMLVIIEVAGQTMLVGATAQHIEKLCDIDPESLQAPATPQSPSTLFADTFKSVLQQNWGRGGPFGKDKKENEHDKPM